jgi:hypothetical protein
MISAKEVREMSAAIIEKRNSELNLELDNVEQIILNHIDHDPCSGCCEVPIRLSNNAILALRDLGYIVVYEYDSYTISWT